MKSQNKLLELPINKLFFLTFLLLMTIWAGFILIPALFGYAGGRYILDPADFNVYFERGKWVLDNSVPLSEYPQVPTYLFGLNRLIVSVFRIEIQRGVFISLMSLEMTLVFLLAIYLLINMVPAEKKPLVSTMLLPTTLYFVLNRFDILPACLCLLSLYFLKNKRVMLAMVFLAIATFTKWYPILLLPGFLIYTFGMDQKKTWKMLMWFLVTCLIIIIPTLIQGGISALLVPYQFHTQRGMEYFSFVVLISKVAQSLIHFPWDPTIAFQVFFFLQIIVPFTSVFMRLDHFDAILDYAVLVIACFILFSRIFSPQWVLWLMPFLILTTRNRWDLLLIVAYSLFSYLLFPVAFDRFGVESFTFELLNAVIYSILTILIVRSFTRLSFSLENLRLFKATYFSRIQIANHQ